MAAVLGGPRFDPQAFLYTNLGNKVSKTASIFGSQAIALSGKVCGSWLEYKETADIAVNCDA